MFSNPSEKEDLRSIMTSEITQSLSPLSNAEDTTAGPALITHMMMTDVLLETDCRSKEGTRRRR